jgi:hypothetical protein
VVRKLIPSQLPTVRTATCQITTPEASPDPLELVQLLDPELDEESSTGSKSKCFVEQHFKGSPSHNPAVSCQISWCRFCPKSWADMALYIKYDIIEFFLVL